PVRRAFPRPRAGRLIGHLLRETDFGPAARSSPRATARLARRATPPADSWYVFLGRLARGRPAVRYRRRVRRAGHAPRDAGRLGHTACLVAPRPRAAPVAGGPEATPRVPAERRPRPLG